MSAGFAKLPRDILIRRNLSCASKLVYAVVLDAMRGKGEVKIGIRRIMAVAGICNRSVLRAIEALRTAGLIEVERGRHGQRATYKLPQKPVTKSHHSTSANTDLTGDNKSPLSGQNVTTSGDKKSPRIDKKTLVDARRGDETTTSRPKAQRKKPADPHNQLIDHFTARWSERNGGAKYPFDRKKDPPAAKRILEHAGELEGAKRVVDAYLGTEDPWLIERGLTLAILASNSQLPRFLSAPKTVEASASPRESHPILADAKRHGWADDVRDNPEAWAEIIRRVDAGDLRDMCVHQSKAKSGAAFRKSVGRKAVSHA